MQEHPESDLNPALSFVLFTLLFGLIVYLVGWAVFTISPNTNSLCGVTFSFLFALPVAYKLFLNPEFSGRVKPYQRFLLPALIFPLCITLSLGLNLLQQRPDSMFKMFVADPIPDGVSNIQAYDISGGFDTEIIIAFDATPEAIDEIIDQNELILVEESNMINKPNYEYFPDIHWDKNWIIYEKSFSDDKVELMTIWVNPEGNTVLFRLVAG